MVDLKNKGYISPFAIHPGETVKEALEFTGMSQVDLATRIELTEKTVSLILNGLQPITPETALKLERVLGLSQKLLLNMQASYDADKFRLEEQARLKKETSSLSKFPCYAELASLGFVQKARDEIMRVEELLKFFGVNSLSSIQTVFPVAFRRSHQEKISEECLAAWLRMGTIQALKRDTADFDKELLEKNIQKMRALTSEPVSVYSQALVQLCAEAGVALTYTPHLKKTCVNGAAQWISPTKALVQVSLRYAYADIFWFTLFHELGHILKHSKKETFIEFEKRTHISEYEAEADLFAQRILIPVGLEPSYQQLKKSLTPGNYAVAIQKFAESAGIDVGIVAGRIGREMGIWRQVSRFRKKLEFKKNEQ